MDHDSEPDDQPQPSLTPPKQTLPESKSISDGPKPWKILGLDDPYKFAPPKPDGDPWAILLEPEMETDRIQCEAWKEEVQTLLIFAGLFSAVVTAFVIESYKFLQPDPNNTIINLLTQIANGPNSTTLSMAPAGATFARSSSSIRINVFWFVSLILSLTTVLVGTIALQWLREHQAYPASSPKQTLALLHMRTESLNAWYVPHVFAALPLFLQAALVLFLAGLIDFTLPLGAKLWVPISCIIGFILLFLAVTTVLPAFQSLLILFDFLAHDVVPSPCAFKSPQSQILRTISGFVLYCLSFVFSGCYLHDSTLPPQDFLRQERHHLFPHIYAVWHRKSWPTFDLEWLSLRDAWHNGILDIEGDLYNHRRWTHSAFPLSDITQCLIAIVNQPTSAKHTQELLAATCYCFEEVTSSVWQPKYFSGPQLSRRNYYFERLFEEPDSVFAPPLSAATFFIHGGIYHNVDTCTVCCLHMDLEPHMKLFQQDHVFLFLQRLLLKHNVASSVIADYCDEIEWRVAKHLLRIDSTLLLKHANINTSKLPTCISGLLSPRIRSLEIPDFLEAVITTLNAQVNIVHVHPNMPGLLEALVMNYLTPLVLETESIRAAESDFDELTGSLGLVFTLAARHLNDEITPKSGISARSIMFYLTAAILKEILEQHRTMPIWQFRHKDLEILKRASNFDQGFAKLFDAVMKLKGRMGSEYRDDANISQWLSQEGSIYMPDDSVATTLALSERWWASLLYDHSRFYGISIDPDVLRVLTKQENGEHSSPTHVCITQDTAQILPTTVSGHPHPGSNDVVSLSNRLVSSTMADVLSTNTPREGDWVIDVQADAETDSSQTET